MAQASGEVLELRHTAPSREKREGPLDIVRVQELLQRTLKELLASPAQGLLPCRIQEREVALRRERREQVAGHLEQACDLLGLAARLLARRWVRCAGFVSAAARAVRVREGGRKR